MREEFSLFSLGIGFDVDYDFLERIATENRGIAQRIYANHDAAEQLRVQNYKSFPLNEEGDSGQQNIGSGRLYSLSNRP